MIEIKKNNEPRTLLTYRLQPNASYSEMPKEVKEVVLHSLMEEQGCLCAYCMRRIPQKKKNPGVTIEHWNAQSDSNREMGLDYHNMFAVCSGNRGCGDKKYLTCDARRGKDPLIVNPLKPETLRTIRYKENGVIFSEDSTINQDLNEHLNLNCSALLLPECRAEALKELQKKVYQDNMGKTASKEYFQNLLSRLLQSNSPKKPYVGILISWLEAKID